MQKRLLALAPYENELVVLTVTDINPNKMVVHLPKFGIYKSLLVPRFEAQGFRWNPAKRELTGMGVKFAKGAQVQVRVTAVDLLYRRFYFEAVDQSWTEGKIVAEEGELSADDVPDSGSDT